MRIFKANENQKYVSFLEKVIMYTRPNNLLKEFRDDGTTHKNTNIIIKFALKILNNYKYNMSDEDILNKVEVSNYYNMFKEVAANLYTPKSFGGKRTKRRRRRTNI